MTPDNLHIFAGKFSPINLDQMDQVSFLSRKDTKYVLSCDKLKGIMEEMLEEYFILEINGFREFSYTSQYLDTYGFGMYMAHHNKRKNRFKFRRRVYENTGLTFWEIKHKTNRDITQKKRIKVTENGISQDELDLFVKRYSPYHFETLEPKLTSRFKRMTFVNKGMSERITIDTDLSWSNEEKEIHLDGLAIVEVKNESKASLAQLFPILNHHGIHPGSFSKYTFGCALLYGNLKKNLLKSKLAHLNKYCHAVSSKHTSHA